MKWNNASEFFAMGGYGLYVWGSYAVALLLMVVEPILARQRHRKALHDAAEQPAHGSKT
jgi:heme exporter protein D